MTSARNVLVADRCRPDSRCPIGVYGPTMKTSSSPMTSGGSSKVASTPASHTRGKGNVPLAIAHASGVQSSRSTPSVTAPDSADRISGSNAPGAPSELVMLLHDRCVTSAMTGPRSATQMTKVPATASDRFACCNPRGTATPPGSTCADADGVTVIQLAPKLFPDRGGHRAGRTGQRRRQQRVAALLGVTRAAGRREHVGDERVACRGVLRAAEGGDVERERRAGFGLRTGAAGNRDRCFGVLVGEGRVAQVDVRRQADVAQVQLLGLRQVSASRVDLAGLQPRVERGLLEDLR